MTKLHIQQQILSHRLCYSARLWLAENLYTHHQLFHSKKQLKCNSVEQLIMISIRNERSSADSCVSQRVNPLAPLSIINFQFHICHALSTSNWCHVYKQQMPDKTETEHGRRNDNMQILFSPGCEQPLRDNDSLPLEHIPLEICYIESWYKNMLTPLLHLQQQLFLVQSF